MNVPDKYKGCFSYIEAGDNIELQDDQTKIIVRDRQDCYRIIVDKGIINDVSHGIKKADFAISESPDGSFYLIELKGAVISAALEQVLKTVENVENSDEFKSLLKGRNKVIACIVSPNRQQIPKGGKSFERELAKKLCAKSKEKPQDMYDLIYYVKVVQKQERPVINRKTRQVVCSNRNPLVLNELG